MSSLSRYEVLGPVGENHFARYFRGYDTVGERDVCIIEFLEKFRKNEDRWHQIWQQILSAGRIKHDYMVSVYDYDRERGRVVTELMQGSLRDLPPTSLQDTELVRTVLYRTLETLDYLHSNQHPHGDIRPANFLYDVAGQTKLSYSPGIALGGQIPRREKDHAFLAPEMFDPSFGPVGIGVDLYGCGMSALSMLLGDDFSKKLIGKAVSDDVAWQRFHRDLNSHPSVRELVPHLPRDMEAVIQKLISKKVEDRFTSIAEARALLIRPEVEVRIQVDDVKPVAEKKKTGSGPPQAFLNPTADIVRPQDREQKLKQKKPRPVRDWLNQKLKNPLVMGLVSACIVAMMMFGIAVVSVYKEMKSPIPVTVSSTPKGASIFVDDKKFSEVTDATLQLTRGAHQLKLELAGHQPATQKVEIPFDAKTFEVPVIALAAIVEEKKPEAPPPPKVPDPPKVEPPTWKLPAGLKPVGEAVDAETKLPLQVGMSEEKLTLQEGDTPLNFVLLPKGKMSFGASEPLEQGELAAQTVEFAAPFYIAAHELTQAQLAAYQKAQSAGGVPQAVPDEFRNYPVLGMPVAGAMEICKWLGPSFDLPSEQEWEWAARGGGERKYPWGDEDPSPEHVRMKPYPIGAAGSIRTIPVAELEKGKTPEGVFHLLGNAAEWCRDLYTPGFKETSETTGAGKLHVIRGGSFRSPGSKPIRLTWRANAPDSGANDVGVRIVCHPEPPQGGQP